MANNAWMELYGSYGLTLWDREANKLSGGITLKILRGMSGAFAKVKDIGVVSESQNDNQIYKIVAGSARYGYSANYGTFDSFQASDLFAGSKTSFAIDLGVEYLIKTQAVTSVYDETDENDYEWKIGFSLLDLGFNKYTYGTESRAAASLKDDVSSFVLQEKFSEITDVSSFNDSLATIVNQSEALTGNFKVKNPVRAVINIDRYVSGNFYVNGELSVNLVSGTNDNNIAVKETKLITITPRWETRKLGFYLPVQFTRHGNFWIGGALKAGPLLFGTHNLINAFAKNKYPSGGAYLALIIRPVNFFHNKEPRNRQYECPVY